MKKKNLCSLFLAAALALALVGCGGDAPVNDVTTESKEVVESTVDTKETEPAAETKAETEVKETAENTIPEGFVVPTSQYDGLKDGYTTITYEGLMFDIPSNFTESSTTPGMWESGLGANLNMQAIENGAAIVPSITVDMYMEPVTKALREAFAQDDLEVTNTNSAHFKVYDEEAFAYDMSYTVTVEGIDVTIGQTQIIIACGSDAKVITFSFSSFDADNSEALKHTIESIRFAE